MIRFLASINFYRDFVPRFSDIASPLYRMAQSERKFKTKAKLTEMHALFEKLKSAFMTAPVLAFPNFELPFVIQCDASSVALGAVIGQMVDNRFRPVMYGSRHLTSAETRYSTTERELLAIVWAAKRFNPYTWSTRDICNRPSASGYNALA